MTSMLSSMLSQGLGNLHVLFIACKSVGDLQVLFIVRNQVLEGLWLLARSCLQAKQTINA
ncbi:hypothetical protein C1H46_036902 [Malus baccata]|uniref:Uncharacterized protein n=1 Tax=Malus baccata TaxID=106549 RepID=A0A540KTL0_MALBA|nr:hypothetical protein C1H46_036902 [Malus baccata]